jgi:hypothetical protein
MRPANAMEVYDRLVPLLPSALAHPDLPMDPTRPFRGPHGTPAPRPTITTTAPGPTVVATRRKTTVAMRPPEQRPRFAERALLAGAVIFGASELVGLILLATAKPMSIQAMLFDLVVTATLLIGWSRVRTRRRTAS